MKFEQVVIIAPALEQRISKMVYSLMKAGLSVTVMAEEIAVSGEFDEYIKGMTFVKIPAAGKLRRTPLGGARKKLIEAELRKRLCTGKKLLVIARDVNYGYIVGGIVKRLPREQLYFVTDVADNYDLLYDSIGNPLLKIGFKTGFGVLTETSFRLSDALLIVSPVNEPRLRSTYAELVKGKPIWLLRNLPIAFRYIDNPDKLPHSFVYVGKIDETSRDPFYVLENLEKMPAYTLHFYSSQKADTLAKIRAYAEEHGFSDRVIFHDRVPYDQLAQEVSRYTIGLVPHKRSAITDYTLPNKMYDYKSSGIVTIMSDCPSLVAENQCYGFGVIYSRAQDDFADAVQQAEAYALDISVPIPTWEQAFDEVLAQLNEL